MASYDKEWIVRYVDGELDPGEKAGFEAALQTDAELAAEVALYREVRAVLAERLPADATGEALKERTAQLNREYFREETIRKESDREDAIRKEPISKISNFRWLQMAAAVACVVVAVELLWPEGYARKIEKLGQTEMIGITERGSQTDTLLRGAAILFNEKQFSKALVILDQVVATDSSSQLALFYRGVAAWHTGDLELARGSLQRVYESGSLLRNDAAYYMALTYAGEKNGAMAREWLQKIPAAEDERLKVKELHKLLK